MQCQLLCCRKNQALAADDRAAAETAAPFGEKVVTGEQGYAEHMAGMREQARQQGTAQHSDVAHQLKEARPVTDHVCGSQYVHAACGEHVLTRPCAVGQDIMSANPEAGANRAA